jgi:hypothetical protein
VPAVKLANISEVAECFEDAEWCVASAIDHITIAATAKHCFDGYSPLILESYTGAHK